jgi:hypothetical protein
VSLIVAFAAVAMAGPAPEAPDFKSPIRCRPAPYLVADAAESSKPEKVLVTGSRVPMRVVDRKGRPCYLTKDGKAIVSRKV